MLPGGPRHLPGTQEAGTQEAFGRRQLVLTGVDKGDLVRDDLLPSGKNTILDVSITRPLVDTAASKYDTLICPQRRCTTTAN